VRSWRLIVVLAAVFVGIAAISATVLVRTARSSDELRVYLAGRFAARPDCPFADPFVETNVDYDCYDGELASGRPVVLILGHEIGSRTTEWSYIGIFVDHAAERAEPTLGAGLAARVRARGDWWGRRAGGPASAHILVPPAESEPVRAERVAEGFFVAWRLASRTTPEKIEARLRELDGG
jgi:hypothetical protein